MPGRMTVPGPFDQAFLDDLPYDPEVLMFDQLLEIDREQSLIRVRWPTTADQPITRAQRNHPRYHPPHVSGALMVHATGLLGFAHAYYVLGLRHHQGWIGYGTHMDGVVFRKLVPPGAIVEASCRAKRSRLGTERHFVRYAFEMRWNDEVCYQSEQSALWVRIGEDGPQVNAP
jgi:hypothetical protein